MTSLIYFSVIGETTLTLLSEAHTLSANIVELKTRVNIHVYCLDANIVELKTRVNIHVYCLDACQNVIYIMSCTCSCDSIVPMYFIYIFGLFLILDFLSLII